MFGAILAVLDKALAVLQLGSIVVDKVSPLVKPKKKERQKLGNQRVATPTNPHAGRRH